MLDKRRTILPVALVIAILTVDLFSDFHGGLSRGHLILEMTSMILIALFVITFKPSKTRVSVTESLWINASKDGVVDRDLKESEKPLSSDLERLTRYYFTKWSLTDAEKDVGGMILQGLSHKEIANRRGTSEKTVRQQAGSVYNKAELDGRSQLSAYFFEKLNCSEKSMERSESEQGVPR